MAAQEYPEGWPSFVSDLLQPLTVGDDMVGRADMLCRLLRALDDDVISMDVPRSQEDSKRSMRVKVVIIGGVFGILDIPASCETHTCTGCLA